VEIKQYKEIEVEVETVQYNEKDLENQIQYILTQNPDKVSKEGLIENGDTAIIDFEGFKDGVAFEGGKGENYELTIGSQTFIPGFEEQMVGMKKGETRDLNLTFPKNYQASELAGADVVFKVVVHDIIENKPAQLNDEFIKKLNIPEVNDVEAFRKYVQDYLQYEANQRTREKAEDAIMNKLLAGVETEIPQNRVDEAIQQQVSRVNNQLQQQGATLEQYLQMTGMSMEDLRNQLTEAAKQQVKLELTLNKIAELEKITVSQEEIEQQYKNIAQSYGMSEEDVQKYITPNTLMKDMLLMKASQIVLQSAKVNHK
jgi:trigger factor